MRDLAPHIHRQRLVIEGRTATPMLPTLLTDYLSKLAAELGMVQLTEPVLNMSPSYGWAGWVHWETSGAHVYAWDDEGFFSVDIYTCKAFDPDHAVTFTAEVFAAEEIVHGEF